MANQNGNNACAQWDDRCMMTDLLDTAKHITEVYGAYVCEGSSDTLRQVLQNNMDATANDQFQIFQQMQQRENLRKSFHIKASFGICFIQYSYCNRFVTLRQ